MEQFITIIVLIVGASLSAWVKKKQENDAKNAEVETPETPPHRSQNAPPPLPRSGGEWGELLRRIMDPEQKAEVEQPQSPPILHPVPAPHAHKTKLEESIKIPPAILRADHNLAQRGKLEKASTAFNAGRRMNESAQAFMRGNQLPKRVSSKLEAVDARVSNPIADAVLQSRTSFNSEAARVRALLRKPSSFREVMLASMIVGEPKSLR